MKRQLSLGLVIFGILLLGPKSAETKDDDFKTVVKSIEQFYRVKHQGLPLLARASIKTVKTAGRIAGGSKKRLAEAGSVKVAYFEDQDFARNRATSEFRSSLNAALTARWTPFVQVMSPKEFEQTYVFLRSAGEKFNVLVVTLAAREATVVQVDLVPATLAELLSDPNEMGKAITDDATINDNQE